MKGHDDRDAAVERLIRRSFQTADTTDGRSCLDAETLAAWADGTLSADAAARVDAHAAGCSRCVALMTAVTQSTPAEGASDGWWGRLGGARWLVPLAAAATVVAIWVAVPRNDRPRVTDLAQVEAPAAPVPPSPDATLQDETAAREADDPSRAADAVRADSPAEAEDQRAADAELRRERAFEINEEEPAQGTRASGDRAAVGLTSASAPSALARQAQAGQIPAIEIRSTDPMVRWRIGAAGLIERSGDAGSSWEPQASGVPTDLTAGACPSPVVCWIVGREGTAILTVDGRTWRPLTFPEPVDLVSVQAVDARAATVTAADGRLFSTADGGLTWQR